MKKLFIATLVLMSISTMAQEIKGLALGMSKDEVTALYPNIKQFTVPGSTQHSIQMTVAGITSKHESIGASVEFYEDKLVSFSFSFKSDSFDSMRNAFKEKYPEMKCEDSVVTNRMGAEFTDTRCRYKELRLNRYMSNLDTSLLGMIDPAQLERFSNNRKKKAAGDI